MKCARSAIQAVVQAALAARSHFDLLDAKQNKAVPTVYARMANQIVPLVSSCAMSVKGYAFDSFGIRDLFVRNGAR